jgi:hypothetical protein
MNDIFAALLFAGGLFLGILLFLEVGRRIGAQRIAKGHAGTRPGIDAAEGAVFALLSLLVAFTISGASSRFEVRRQLVAQEVNAISTAYLRLDLLAPDARSALQGLFRNYVDSRIETYRKRPDTEAGQAEWARSVTLQSEIWTKVVAATRAQDQPHVAILLLPAMNAMIDITTTRAVAAKTHPPMIVFVLLSGLALGCSLLAGFGMASGKSRSWTHIIGFAAIMTITVYVIIEIEYPRLGLIRVDAVDQVLVELRQSMQ